MILGASSFCAGGRLAWQSRRLYTSTFGDKTKAERLRALHASAGSWSDRRLTGADHVDALRGDLNERMRRLGVE
ncbi:MAG: antitoxin [Actinobacteria bacterium]|nr:antitoxin [Actinomycetota bacterium]